MCSEVTPDGRYGIVLSYGQTVRWLSYDDVLAHCTATIRATVAAEHDAAVVRQLHHTLGMSLQDAGAVLMELRGARLRPDAQALQPLGLEPGVTVEGKPFLTLSVGGHQVGQWGPAEARNHAMACLELAAAVSLDNAFYDFLTTGDGSLPENTARSVVGNLGQYIGRHAVVEA